MEQRIDSPANKKVKLAASLHNRKHRDKEGLFIAEGIRLVEMAAASDWNIRYGFYTPELLNQAAMVPSSAVGLWRASTIMTPRSKEPGSAKKSSMSFPQRSRSAWDTLAKP